MMPGQLDVVLLVDEEWYAPFFADLALILESTGETSARLLVCLDKTPDPEGTRPCTRISEHGMDQPKHAYDWENITGYERALADVDTYFRGRHQVAAQSLCAEAEAAFARQRPDCLVVWSGTRLGPRAVAAAAHACGVPVVSLETPYFQNLPDAACDAVLTLHKMSNRTLIWDTVQAPQCGPSQLTRDWSDTAPRPGLQSFLDELHRKRVSKFSAEDIQRFMQGKGGSAVADPALALFKPPGAKALLVCGQVDRDSSMYFNHHLVRTWYDLGIECAKRLPEGWILWFKGHPLDRGWSEGAADFAHELLAVNPKCRVLPPGLDIHTCFLACDAMACINSTAGIEAMTHGLPVVNLGQASYTHQGMTHTLGDLDEFGLTVAELPSRMTAEQLSLRDRFLSYVLYDYLIPVSAPERMISRIRQAIAEQRRT
jgi:hypothetical protein